MLEQQGKGRRASHAPSEPCVETTLKISSWTLPHFSKQKFSFNYFGLQRKGEATTKYRSLATVLEYIVCFTANGVSAAAVRFGPVLALFCGTETKTIGSVPQNREPKPKPPVSVLGGSVPVKTRFQSVPPI